MFSVNSLHIGTPRDVVYAGDRKLKTSLYRNPVKGKVFLDLLGFEGDQVADPVNHGGRDKAVCGYPADHYPFWERELSREMTAPAFGENLTVSGLTEDQVHIGDIFRIGEAEIQCSQPRQPCHKLTKTFGLPKLASRIQSLGYCGYYFRVLKQGWVQVGMEVERIHYDKAEISVADAHYLMYRDKSDYENIKKLLNHPALSESWKAVLIRRLENRKL
ncbi:MAG: MOSC domain-containing protein [Nitrospinota bacterium]|nr:MOSC domain-containing protein [Nitrospinota bacterium]